MKISISVPFYNYQDINTLRYQLTKKCFQHYYNIQKRLNKKGIFLYLNFVGSEENLSYNLVKPFLNEYNTYTEYLQIGGDTWWIRDGNLRDKYNSCFQYAKNCDDTFKYHCISGSNDFVDEIFFEQLAAINETNISPIDRKKKKQIGLIGVSANSNRNNLFVLDYLNKRAFTSTGIYRNYSLGYGIVFINKFIGGFYALSTKLLSDLNYKPFQFDADEIGLEQYCVDNYSTIAIDSDILNIKSDSDLNSYEACLTFKDNDINSDKLESLLLYIDSL